MSIFVMTNFDSGPACCCSRFGVYVVTVPPSQAGLGKWCAICFPYNPLGVIFHPGFCHRKPFDVDFLGLPSVTASISGVSRCNLPCLPRSREPIKIIGGIFSRQLGPDLRARATGKFLHWPVYTSRWATTSIELRSEVTRAYWLV